MVCAVVAQSLCKYMHFGIEFAQILCLRMVEHVCTMFAQGLRRVCAMFAHVGAKLFLFAQLSNLRKHWIRFTHDYACLRMFTHVVREHKNVCPVFAHVCEEGASNWIPEPGLE